MVVKQKLDGKFQSSIPSSFFSHTKSNERKSQKFPSSEAKKKWLTGLNSVHEKVDPLLRVESYDKDYDNTSTDDTGALGGT